jgi:leucyl-tRNA synthetase
MVSFDWVEKCVLQIQIIKTYPMDFYQLFNSWYNKNSDKSGYFDIVLFREEGNATVNAVCDENHFFFGS